MGSHRHRKMTLQDYLFFLLMIVLFAIFILVTKYCCKHRRDNASHSAPIVITSAQYTPLTTASNVQRTNDGSSCANSNQGNPNQNQPNMFLSHENMYPNRTQYNPYPGPVQYRAEQRDYEVPVLAPRSFTVPPGAFPPFPTDDTIRGNSNQPSYNQFVI